jgi:hypothetical protein
MHIMQGLLQSEIEGVANENVGFYGRCALHATYATSESYCDPINSEIGCQGEKELACARTEVLCQFIGVFLLDGCWG